MDTTAWCDRGTHTFFSNLHKGGSIVHAEIGAPGPGGLPPTEAAIAARTTMRTNLSIFCFKRSLYFFRASAKN